MTIWDRIKKWAFEQPVTHVQSVENDEPEMDHQVGEPVASFIRSLHREGKRRYTLTEVDVVEFAAQCVDGVEHHWMSASSTRRYKLVDRKFNMTYYALITSGKLYSVFGLPFDLSHWECKAVLKAFQAFRNPARDRKARILGSRRHREYDAKCKQHAMERERFTAYFKEDAE